MNKHIFSIIILIIVLFFVGAVWTYTHQDPPVPTTLVSEPAATDPPVLATEPSVPPSLPVSTLPLSSRQTAIFYIPHSDDEILSMGAAILEAKKSYDPVILVLLTKGKASGAFPLVNDQLNMEGLPSIDITEFGEARVRDFRASAQALGIASDNVYVYDLPDGQVTSKSVKDIILTFETKYLHALHQSMSYLDPHPDHAAAGTALQQLRNEYLIDSPRYYVSIQLWGSYPAANMIKLTSTNSIARFKRSLKAYHLWSPAKGRYQISIFSVKDYFDTAANHYESHWYN